MHHDEHSVHGRFAEIAAKTPDATALRADGLELSYAELDERADRLSRELVRAGVRSGDPVGVLLERSGELIVTLLAVLKAGGHYVAVEPDDPPDRVDLLLRQAGVRVVVTTRGSAAGTTEAERLVIDDVDWSADEPVAAREVAAEDLAYVAYTSGSTGVPRGVAIPHRAVLRLLYSNHFLELGADDAVLQLAPVAFDASTLEIWAPLLSGARLVQHPAGPPDPDGLLNLVEREGVTVMWLTAGLFHLVVDRNGGRFPSSLRTLLAGGDVLSPSHVDRALAGTPGLRVVNGYGPTENTTFTCCAVVTEPVGTGPVPIGRPIAGTTAHLLDEHLAAVSDGEVGELYAGGEGVAHGYVAHPRATAERFLPDPFSAEPGARLYRTGDLARRNPNGDLEFLGRGDNQVKIRGFRVEPGETEAVLRRLPHVIDCVVVAQEDPVRGRFLAGFVAAAEPLSLPEVRRCLTAELPAHLVPAVLSQLERLPLTANGKVDRALLAVTGLGTRPDCEQPYRAAGTDLERELVQLWSDVLGLDRIGVDDDFFELGGHSLLASRITREIAGSRDVLVTARAFYEHTTIAELAGLVGRLSARAGEVSA